MSFQIRFNITKTATEVLIKFIKLVLIENSDNDFKTFSDSIYLTKKILGLEDNFQNFISYSKCYKLYQKVEVTNFQQENILAIIKYQHVKFPNSSLHKLHLCNIPLSQKIGLSANQIIIRSNLIYSFSGIK